MQIISFINLLMEVAFRSGIDEPVCEKNILLQEVNSICSETNYNFKSKKNTSISREEHISLLGKRLRDESAASHFVASTSKDNDETPILNECIILEDHNYGKYFLDNIADSKIL